MNTIINTMLISLFLVLVNSNLIINTTIDINEIDSASNVVLVSMLKDIANVNAASAMLGGSTATIPVNACNDVIKLLRGTIPWPTELIIAESNTPAPSGILSCNLTNTVANTSTPLMIASTNYR